MYLIFGTRTNGNIIDYHLTYTRGKYGGVTDSPIVEFKTENTIVRFIGEESIDFKIGDRVNVLFLPWNPKKAKIFSFLNLFTRPGIELFICLFIWWAFISSFKNIFDKPITKLFSGKKGIDKIKFNNPTQKIIINKVDKKSSTYKKESVPLTVFFIFITIALIIPLIIAIISVTQVYLSNQLSFKSYIIVLFIIGIVIFLLVKYFKK